jgi:hypothetical protein
MLETFAEWLSTSYLNSLFADTTRTATWLIVPTSQSIHIIAVAILMMSVLIINCRILGIAGTRQPLARLSAQLTPWIWPALIVLLLTGTIQTIAEPMRELLSTTFWLKMGMLAITLVITVVTASFLRRDAHFWERSRARRVTLKGLATLSLVLWVAIVAAGRLIAYI